MKDAVALQLLLNIQQDLVSHKRPRKTVLEESIKDRLNQSAQIYYQELQDSVDYISHRNAPYISKKLKAGEKDDQK